MPASRGRSQVWYESINLDLILYILKTSLFHPYVASLIPVCLRAGDIPFSAPAFRNSVIYALLVCLLWLLAPLNERVAYGKRREVNADGEVIVITGGANGLGRCLAEIYAMYGTSIAVIDVQTPKDEIDGVMYHKCDISDSIAVSRTWRDICSELGTPTVLINNAGIVRSNRLLDLTTADVQSTFQVNTIAQHTLSLFFLRGLVDTKKPGTLVTVSSVLGRLGAAHLSAYTASKAALIAYHNSITVELECHPQIKTILVTPGQLSTEMFSNVRQNAVQRFFGPVVEVQQLAMKMVRMIGEGRGGQLAEPAYTRWIVILDVLPAGISKSLRRLAGVDTAMSSTVG